MRLKVSVMRKLGKTSKKGKLERKWSYQKQKILKTLTLSEEEITRTTSDRGSLQEIEYKQNPGATRGLLHVSDDVFHFFTDLHIQVQKQLTDSNLHLNLDNIHLKCRNFILQNNVLIQKWIELFEYQEDDDENEVFLIMLFELFEIITEHFLRISLADAITKFKEAIPRTKKQALRSKIQALSERTEVAGKKPRMSTLENEIASSDIFICGKCKKVCSEEPECIKDQSIGCDSCNNWFHYSCMAIKGTEKFLQSEVSTWKCVSCRKGKGKGKSSTKSK
ncbi:uncharacterized protein LOC134684780 [Mytilus trossulus]|uniref:uncharacterized protein LOC134684780 n=1 Tax=Mytilus trossulus TaxID=6551 RepID=UPI0030072B59